MTTPITTCYRHGDRRAGVTCQRCNRPICANCMIQASVGFQCPECARGGRQQISNTANLRAVDRPYATYVIIALNVIVFVAGEALARRGVDLAVEGGLFSATQRGFGVGVAGGEWWRIVTSAFLHANLLHLGMNMLVLWMIGTQLESAIGRGKFVGLYVTSLLAASFAVLLFSPGALTVGASGAVYGLFGVVFVHQRSLGIDPWRSGVGGLIVINLLFSFAFPGISIAGHLGGLIGGGLAALAVFALERQVKSQAAAVGLCVALSVVLASACLYVARYPIL